MATAAQTTVRTDPYRAFNFLVRLVDSSGSPGGTTPSQQGTPSGGFSECSGIEMGLDIEEYKEGGNNAGSLRFPTRVKWTNLRLKRGMALTDDLWNWHFSFVQGQVVRRDGVVTLLDEQQNPVKTWSFRRGLPVKWTGPNMNATNNQVAIEELEIAHEGLKLL
jgi:phage tail-like protein